MVGICYRCPNQADEAEETLLLLLRDILGQQNLVLKGAFNYPDSCCENNTAVVHNNTARQEQLQLWAVIHPFPVSSYSGGDEGHHASLAEVFAPLV